MTGQDLLMTFGIFTAIIMAGFLQFRYVLELELSLRVFMMPLVVALGVSTLMFRMRVLQRALNMKSDHLKEMNLEVTQLNQQLTRRLSDRTQLLEEVKSQLSDAQQLGAMNPLIEGALKDLNSSLMVISSCWEELAELDGLTPRSDERGRLEDTAELKEAITQALTQAQQYQALHALPTKGEATPVPEVMERLTPFLSRSFASGQKLSVLWEHRAPCYVALPLGRFVQVILNVVENAREALSGEPGEVKVKLLLLNQAGGDVLQISVIDTGCGMSEVVKARATEAFYTTKRGGIGLGLHVSLNAIREADGALMISSAEGAGARVKITLPCVA